MIHQILQALILTSDWDELKRCVSNSNGIISRNSVSVDDNRVVLEIPIK